MSQERPLRFLCHGKPTLKIAARFGWLPGARYTNLRDIRGFERIGMIDIEWTKYDFKKHLQAVKDTRPLLTVAQDVERSRNLQRVLDQAWELSLWCQRVVIVPKAPSLAENLLELIPKRFTLGYSVPTKCGSTRIALKCFGRRSVHLLGGRPDVQFELSKVLNVSSFDGNRFTLDAGYGDYFRRDRFVPHPTGGYYECIRSSLTEINRLWKKPSLD